MFALRADRPECDDSVRVMFPVGMLGGGFPAGYPVGTVAEVKRDAAQSLADVDVKPAAALDRSRELMFVWLRPQAAPTPAAAPHAVPTQTPTQAPTQTSTQAPTQPASRAPGAAIAPASTPSPAKAPPPAKLPPPPKTPPPAGANDE